MEWAGLDLDGSDGDDELVRRVADGSEAAFAVLYDRHAPAVFRAALRLNPDRGAAEEVTQETFLALWNRAELFEPSRGSLAAWLATIARNRAVDRLRATARRLRAAPFSALTAGQPDESATVEWLVASGDLVAAGSPELGPEAALAVNETGAAVAAALTTLTEPERQAILLAYRDGLSQSEIAAELGWPLGTVKTRSRRAFQRLREALEPTPAPPVAASVVGLRQPVTSRSGALGCCAPIG
jgi:RNA polymerase sigma-70 factor (ECF subfamily)